MVLDRSTVTIVTLEASGLQNSSKLTVGSFLHHRVLVVMFLLLAYLLVFVNLYSIRFMSNYFCSLYVLFVDFNNSFKTTFVSNTHHCLSNLCDLRLKNNNWIRIIIII